MAAYMDVWLAADGGMDVRMDACIHSCMDT